MVHANTCEHNGEYVTNKLMNSLTNMNINNLTQTFIRRKKCRKEDRNKKISWFFVAFCAYRQIFSKVGLVQIQETLKIKVFKIDHIRAN